MRDKQALMGVSSKWRIMYMQMRHIKQSFHYSKIGDLFLNLWHMYPYSTKHTLVSLICNYVIEM